MDDRRVGGAAALGAGLAEAGDRQHHEPGVHRQHVLEGEAELGHDPGPVVLDDDVGFGDELQHQLPRPLRQEVDADGALAGVLLVEVAPDAVDLAAHEAGHVTLRGLHLQDVGAEVGQHAGGEGARQHPGEVQDANACQGMARWLALRLVHAHCLALRRICRRQSVGRQKRRAPTRAPDLALPPAGAQTRHRGHAWPSRVTISAHSAA